LALFEFIHTTHDQVKKQNEKLTTMKSISKISVQLSISGLLIACAGCASIITSGDRKIGITSEPTGAQITVFNAQSNTVATGTTPTEIKLKKGAGYFKGAGYRLVVEKTGYQTREFEIRHNLNGWYFGNLFLGGALGMLVVDPLTGGMWVLKPDKIDAQLTAATPGITRDDQRLIILTKDQLPIEQQGSLVKLPGTMPASPEQGFQGTKPSLN
jgi:hypothetical protein